MIGTTLAYYRITAALGAGGMGEVWRATDSRLGREVALKLLPADFAEDPERHARFEREARTLASLNHPNVATLYGLEHLDGQHVLVMELVEGEGLDEVIARGPVPVDEAIPIALQIAEGLEAAHEAGIVHRDLKPANVRIRPDGTVKVLDFGLAKAWEAGGDSKLSFSPTITSHHTRAGVILGTAAYMSPEQARGKPVDRRADIWAFGAVLWEMLTGRQLFRGETVSDVLAAVLRETPDPGALPAVTPAAVRGLLARCLERDPRRRLRDVGEARVLLDGLEAEPVDANGPGPEPAARRGGDRPAAWRRGLSWAVAAAASMVAVAAWLAGPPSPAPPSRLVASILPPTGSGFDTGIALALSPDGSRLVVAVVDEEGHHDLWLRELATGSFRKIEGTRGAEHPFWSPDGGSLGFLADGAYRKVELASGVIEILAESGVWASGSAWSPLGTIVTAAAWSGRMRTFPATGERSDASPTGEALGSDLLVWPTFLPDGRHYLYLARRYASRGRSGEIRVAALGSSESRVVLEANSNVLFTEPGHLLWWQDGNLREQRFDTVRLELVGESRAVIPGVRFDPGSGRMAVTVAGNGVLVYQEGGDQEGDEMVLLDRAGRQIGAVGAVGTYYGPRLSPDGRRVVVDVSDTTNRGDVWVFDVDRNGGTRLSFAPEDETRPRWSSDGRRVVYSSMAGSELMALWVRDLDGGPEPRRMTEDAEEHLRVTDWASSGPVLLDRLGSEGEDLYLYDPGTGELEPWLATRFVERTASASPDGRFAAYVSEDSGRAEVWVRRFPQADEAWRVSVRGGDWPCWRRDGGELYYVAPDGWLTAVAVEWRQGRQGSEPGFGEPVPLFRFESKAHVDRQYDTLDGELFLVNRSLRTGTHTPLTVVQGWQAEFAGR